MANAKNTDRQPPRQAAGDAAFRLMTVRVPRQLLEAVDNGSKRAGARRQTLVTQAMVEKLERMR